MNEAAIIAESSVIKYLQRKNIHDKHIETKKATVMCRFPVGRYMFEVRVVEVLLPTVPGRMCGG